MVEVLYMLLMVSTVIEVEPTQLGTDMDHAECIGKAVGYAYQTADMAVSFVCKPQETWMEPSR